MEPLKLILVAFILPTKVISGNTVINELNE